MGHQHGRHLPERPAYNPIDYTGAVAGQYYANNVEILDPEVPLKPGVIRWPSQAARHNRNQSLKPGDQCR
ncbi:MAG: hypothetical protein WDO73_00360 [Ignavibacteriota bacterium]